MILNDINSLPPHPFHFLTARRLFSLLILSKLYKSRKSQRQSASTSMKRAVCRHFRKRRLFTRNRHGHGGNAHRVASKDERDVRLLGEFGYPKTLIPENPPAVGYGRNQYPE